MSAISVLIKPASSLCNMSCNYCFYCDESKKREHTSYGLMTESTLKNVIRKTMLQAGSSISYAFQGGEPTLCGIDFYEKVLFYQQKYNKNGIVISNAIQTNGYSINADWCQFFQDHHFLVGLSIDGTKETHDQLRHTPDGNPTFQHVSNAARLLSQYAVDCNILTVVTPPVAAHIKTIYHYYRSQGWNYQQYIACLDPLDEVRGQKSHSLTPDIYGSFLIDLFSLWHEDYLARKQPYIRQFENYVGLAAGFSAESCEQGGTCSIQYVVEADGSVYPCDFYAIDHYNLGNFNMDRLHVIDQKRSDLHFVERSFQLDQSCQTCPYYALCRGGCQRCRDLSQETNRYTNYFCKSYRMFFDCYYDTILEIAHHLPM